MLLFIGCSDSTDKENKTESNISNSPLTVELSYDDSSILHNLKLTIKNTSNTNVEVRNIFNHPAFSRILLFDTNKKLIENITPSVSFGMLPDKITIPSSGIKEFYPTLWVTEDKINVAEYFCFEFEGPDTPKIKTNLLKIKR